MKSKYERALTTIAVSISNEKYNKRKRNQLLICFTRLQELVQKENPVYVEFGNINGYIGCKCPMCETVYGNEQITSHKYCRECGQRLAYDEEERLRSMHA